MCVRGSDRPAPRPGNPESCPDTRTEAHSTDEEPLMTLLDSLKKYTTVVADTGDIEAIAAFKPRDTTTNPSLLFHAAQQPQYSHLVEQAIQEASERGGDKASQTEEFMDGLFVSFGREILKIVPGRVST